jgi:hypothetical protein
MGAGLGTGLETCHAVVHGWRRANDQPGRTDVGPGWLQLLGACNTRSSLGVSNAFTVVQKIALMLSSIRRIIQPRGWRVLVATAAEDIRS